MKKNKMKTLKALARRVKVSGTGKVLHASNFHRHLKRNKSKGQLRRLKGVKEFSPGFARKVKQRLGVA
ncbi:MAG: 50S ribosomal protein L35 [Patescibacteria group bacterium]|nr:50S ribosomal protein L35 [Patescibacteria group bacterium]